MKLGHFEKQGRAFYGIAPRQFLCSSESLDHGIPQLIDSSLVIPVDRSRIVPASRRRSHETVSVFQQFLGGPKR